MDASCLAHWEHDGCTANDATHKGKKQDTTRDAHCVKGASCFSLSWIQFKTNLHLSPQTMENLCVGDKFTPQTTSVQNKRCRYTLFVCSRTLQSKHKVLQKPPFFHQGCLSVHFSTTKSWTSVTSWSLMVKPKRSFVHCFPSDSKNGIFLSLVRVTPLLVKLATQFNNVRTFLFSFCGPKKQMRPPY